MQAVLIGVFGVVLLAGCGRGDASSATPAGDDGLQSANSGPSPTLVPTPTSTGTTSTPMGNGPGAPLPAMNTPTTPSVVAPTAPSATAPREQTDAGAGSPEPSIASDSGSTDPTPGEAPEDPPNSVDAGSVAAPPTAPPQTSTPAPPDTSDCEVAAGLAGPIGYGASTTGGGDAAPIDVSSFAEAEAALDDYRDAFEDGTRTRLVLRYTGSFDFSSISDVCVQHTLPSQILQIKEMQNVTFEGAAGSSANFGIKINRAKNVIVRNMTMGLLPGGGDSDAITIEGNGTNGDVENIWIDHNELFSSTKDDCDGAGDTEFDGLIDIKKGARYITISHNYIHDHQKTGLIGHSDTDDMDRYVTFHHNWYQNVTSRTPLHRFGYVHLFNNYYQGILSSGINVRMGGVALIEANYFESAMNPVTSRYSDVVGYWDLRDNYVGDGITWTTESDTLANAENWESTATFPPNELDYSYAPDPAHCVKQTVMSRAGATLGL